MDLHGALTAIPEAAKTWKGVVVFVAYVTGTVVVGLRVKRNKNLLKSIEKFPAEDRLAALRAEMGRPIHLKEGITAEEYLAITRSKYYFLAFVLVVLCLAALAGVSVYNRNRPAITNYISQIFQLNTQSGSGDSSKTDVEHRKSGDHPAHDPVADNDSPAPVDRRLFDPHYGEKLPPPSEQNNNNVAIEAGNSGPNSVYPVPPPTIETRTAETQAPLGGSVTRVVSAPSNTVATQQHPLTGNPSLDFVPSEKLWQSVVDRLADYRKMNGHKAFVISTFGASGRFRGFPTPEIATQKAMDYCVEHAKAPGDHCYVYFVDDERKGTWPASGVNPVE